MLFRSPRTDRKQKRQAIRLAGERIDGKRPDAIAERDVLATCPFGHYATIARSTRGRAATGRSGGPRPKTTVIWTFACGDSGGVSTEGASSTTGDSSATTGIAQTTTGVVPTTGPVPTTSSATATSRRGLGLVTSIQHQKAASCCETHPKDLERPTPHHHVRTIILSRQSCASCTDA